MSEEMRVFLVLKKVDSGDLVLSATCLDYLEAEECIGNDEGMILITHKVYHFNKKVDPSS